MTAHQWSREEGVPAAPGGHAESGRRRHQDRSSGRRRNERRGAERTARALGWLSIGIGLAEVAAPRVLAKAIGLHDGTIAGRTGSGGVSALRSGIRGALAAPLSRVGARSPSHDVDPETVLRLFGLREIGTGIGIFARPRDSRWLWARVAGDFLDLAFLALQSPRAEPRRLATAAAAVAGVTALDLFSARRLGEPHKPSRTLQKDGSIRIVEAIVVNRTPAECYRAWRDLGKLSGILEHVEEIVQTGPRTSHWRVTGPAGTDVEWDAEITADEPDQLVIWRSVEGSEIENEGSVRFQPGPKGRGALVRVSLRYGPPAGALGSFVATLFGEDPEQQIRDDLRRFKQFLETGEVLTTEGQPAGPRRILARAIGASAPSGKERRSAAG